MDITKFFEPVRSFTSYLVDRMSLFFITCGLIFFTVNWSSFGVQRSYFVDIPTDVLEKFGIAGDNRTVLAAVVGLLALVSVLEIHEKFLRLLNLFSPVQFSSYNSYDDFPFRSYGPIIWKGYCRQIDLEELRSLFHLMTVKMRYDVQPRSRKSEIFDFIPAWLFVLILTYVFIPRAELAISLFGVVGLLVVLVLIGLVWAFYNGNDSSADSYKINSLALAALLEKKPHEFVSFNHEQRDQLENYQKWNEPQKQWRVPILRFPWIDLVTSTINYIRSRAIRPKSAWDCFRRWLTGRIPSIIRS